MADATTNKILQVPMAKWAEVYEKLTGDQRRIVDDEAAALATKAARLSAYMSRRMSGGKHEHAVKAQNVAARRVRQALGFTYKDDAITF